MGWRQPSAGSGHRTARLAGAGLVSVVSGLAAAYLLLPFAARTLVRALTLTVRGCVWLAAAMSSGADPWTMLAAVGRAAGGALATTEVSSALLVLAGVGALAFYWLQRLLDADEESSK